jgi:hypothetical protein
MTKGQKEILEWLIEDIDFSNPKDLFDNEHEKEITTNQNTFDIFELEEVDYIGRKLIRRKNTTTIYFYPLAIKNYLKE